MIIVMWIVVALVAIAFYVKQAYSKFSKLGVNHLPVVPFFGNLFGSVLQFENICEYLSRLHSAFPDDKVVGMYEMMNPVFMVQDVDTIKKVTIKDFDHFVDRRVFTSELDPNFGRSLLNLRGDEWKEMRSTLSPAFTSSKIRLMVPFMVEVGEEMIDVLHKRIKDSGNQHIDVNLRDITTRYANDVIASCAFGLKVESQSTDSHFYIKAKDITDFTFLRVLKVVFHRSFPGIADRLKVRIASSDTTNFFRNVVLGTMAERDQKNIIRHDMIHILNEIKKGKLIHEKETKNNDASAGFATVEESGFGKKVHNREWTDTELVAQAILFLLAGYETVSSTMSFILHELAVNPEVQEKLVKEINDNHQKNNGIFDYSSIQGMKYLDMVVSEGLRLHPPAQLLDRICVKDYNFGKVNKSSTRDLIVRKGDIIGYPIWIFHRNPELFPDPLKFDPERFSEENRHKIKPFSYMPFGLGPRNCIGSRFALCEVKVMLYVLLRKIKLTPCEKTEIPLKLENGVLMKVNKGGWLRFHIRQ